MKTLTRRKLNITGILTGFCCILGTSALQGQTYKVLHSFNDTDGNGPPAAVLYSEGRLYGTTVAGGACGDCDDIGGTVYSLRPDGTRFNVVADFSESGDLGVSPYSGLTLVDGKLYGTAFAGGGYGLGVCTQSDWAEGTIFEVGTNGAGFEETYGAQNCNMVMYPSAGVAYYNGTFYGTSTQMALQAPGGCECCGAGAGTIFSFTDGSALNNLYFFQCSNPYDGNYWYGSGLANNGVLFVYNGILYGVTPWGGTAGYGTVYSFNPATSSLSILYNFTDGSDGAYPFGGLVLLGTNLYGTTSAGGSDGGGTVFMVGTNGGGLTVVHQFDGTHGSAPVAGLLLDGHTLFGTTSGGGADDGGTVFSVETNGAGFEVLHNFAGSANDGSLPECSLIMEDGVLYGTTAQGGTNDYGTVFSLNLNCPVWDWWRAEENCTNSGSDGSADNGTAHGTLTYAAGVSGYAFDFNGSSTYIDFGASAGNFGTNDFEIDFYLQTTNAHELAVLSKRPACGLANFWDVRLATGGKVAFAICQDTSGTDHLTAESTSVVNDGQWHEVTVIRQSTTIQIYIDGTLESTATGGAGPANINNTTHCEAGDDICIGSDGTQYYQGLLDEIRLMALCR